MRLVSFLLLAMMMVSLLTVGVFAEGENANVAKIGDAYYETLAKAIEVAQAGDEVVLLADTTEDVTVPAGVIFNGNGKQVGAITAAGEITFKGHTKAVSFSVEYTNTTINIGEGACLEITGTGRLVIGHGCTFNITGTITDAKTADKATIQPSLIMPGASFTGAGVTFNVTNAYIKAPSSYCSSSKSASGTFDFNVTNSIFETAGKLAFESQSTAATVNFELKDSVLTTGSHLVFGVSRGEIVIDNSNVNVGTSRQIENQSTMTVKNGSVVNGAVATSSNAKNPGTLIIDNATYSVTGEFSGSDLGTGTLIIKKGGSFTAGSVTKADIQIDATGMKAGDEVNIDANLSNLSGTIEVVNNDKLEGKIVDGKIVLADAPVASIGDVKYQTLQDALKALKDGDTLTFLTDITIDELWDCRDNGAKITASNVTINGNGKTLKLTGTVNDANWNTVFRVEGDGVWFHKLTIDVSEATGVQRGISAKLSIDVTECTFIGNDNAKRAIIYGEGAGTAIGAVEVQIIASKFINWSYGVSDNQNAQDAKYVDISNCVFNDANVLVSASETVYFDNNEMDGGYVNISSYSVPNALSVRAMNSKVDADFADDNKIVAAKIANANGFQTPVAEVDGVRYLDLADALNAAAAATGNVTVEILADIDLTGVVWTPVTISAPGYPMVTVNGNDKTITGLTDMLFAGTWAGGSGLIINDLTIKDSAIVNDENDAEGTVGVGAFIGFPQASATITLNNCHLVNSIVKGGHWTGGLIGYAAGYAGTDGPVFMNLTIKDCSVTGSTISGKGSVGGIIGHATGNAWTGVAIETTTVSGNTVTSTGSSTNKAGAVIGTIGAAGQATTVNGVEKTGGVAVSATVSGNTVTSNGTTITTVYGRQGTNTGMLEIAGGSYDSKPIEDNVAYAAPSEGYMLVENSDGTYGIDVDPAYGKVAKIGDTYYETLAEAVAAAQSGDTIILLNGEHELPVFSGKELTFEGETKDGVIINDAPDARTQGWIGSTIHFVNLTAKGATANYHGLANGVVAVTYENCNVNGLRFLYAQDVSFTDCAFNANGVEHSFWTYGASNITVTNCTFTYTDRAVNCYSESGANHEVDIAFTDCTFTYAGTSDAPEGAVEINSGSVKSIDLTMDDCTAPEKGAMWFNSQWDSQNGKNTVVKVDGEFVWKPLKGTGTAEDPFLIQDIDDLIWFRDEVNAGNTYAGKTIKLADDIDLGSKEWTPIGNSSNQFMGYFDGNDKTISNLKITGNNRYVGLFGYIKGNGMSSSTTPSVKDLTLTNVSVSGDYYVGGLSGQAYTCNITNVHVSGTVSGTRYVGGLVGHVYTYFKDCSFTGEATCSFDALGGIAGAGDCRAYDCSVIGTVSGSNWVGGIVGNGQEGTSAVGCYVKANVSTSSNWYFGVGGIAGVAGHGYTGSEFRNNYFDGEVYLEGTKVDAIIMGIVNANDNASIGTVVEGNSWNTAYYPAETPVYVVAEIAKSDATPDQWKAGASAEKSSVRNNNLVMYESDLQYVDAESADDVTILPGSDVTQEQVEQAVFDNNAKAQVGNVKYATLADALAAAKDGDIITLIWAEGDAPIAMNGAVFGKTVTITGTATVDWSKGWLYVGRGGAGNGTVIFDNANLTSASNSSSYGIHVSGREKNTDNKYDGTLIIKNSTIELDYLINRGTIEVDNSSFTVKNGFGIAGRPAVETENGEAATATITIKNGSYVKVLSHGGMGIGVAASVKEGYGILNLIDSTFECANFNVDTEMGDFNVSGISTVKINTLSGKKIDVEADATLKDSTIGGSINMLGNLTIDGDLTLTGGLWVGKSGETLTATLSGDKLTATYFMFQRGSYTINADIDAVYGYLSFEATFEVNSTITTSNTNGEPMYINGNVNLNSGAEFVAKNVWLSNENTVLNVKEGASVTVTGKLNVANAGAELYSAGNINGQIVNSSNGTIKISGGTYTQDVSAWCVDGYVCEENADGTYGVREEKHLVIVVSPVAPMSTTTITVATMDEAVAHALANPHDSVIYQITGPVVLTTGGSHGIINLGNNVTIEGVTDEAKLTIVGGGVPDFKGVTFKNITLADEGTYLPEANEFMYQNYIDCTFVNVTFEEGIRVNGNTTITNCTINSEKVNQYALWSDGGTVTMTGTTVIVDGEGYGMVKSDNATKYVLTNNTFTYENEANKEALNTKDATIDASNNTFVGCAEGIIPADKTNYAADGTTVLTAEAIAAGNLVAVAKIGDTYYATLAEAIAAAQEGDTLTLLADVTLTETLTVPAGKIVTLDLNGKTVSQTKACTASYEMINNKGTLTITGNGKISLTDTGAGDSSFGWGSYTIRNEGTLVVENGTIEFKGNQTPGTHCSLAIFQYSGSTTINGGSIINNAYRSVRLWKGDMTINGGSFEGQVWVHCVDDSAELTITGGNFSPRGNDGSSVFVNNSGKVAVLAITGGTFTTKIGANDTAALAGAITGGSFSEAAKNGTNTALIADGYLFPATTDANGYYVVIDDETAKADHEAKIGTIGYKTLADAIAAGGNVVLLKDIELSDILVINGAVTIDGNGHKITSTAGRAINIDTTAAVTIENLTIVGSTGCERGINIINQAGITNLSNVKISGVSHYAVHVATSAGAAQVNIEDSELSGYAALAVYGEGSVVEVSGSALSSVNEYADNGSNSFATIVIAANDAEISVVGGSVSATAEAGKAPQAVVGMNAGRTNMTLYLDTELVKNGTATLLGIDPAAVDITLRAEYADEANAEGYAVIEDVNGMITVKAAVARIGDTYYATLEEAFAAIGSGDVVIELLADATFDYNARDAYGLADTTSITINGNGHTLTLNQKNSDWASLGMANANGKLVLNNMTIEKTGYGDTSGAWNTHAIIFSCNVEMNNVTVNNGIAVQNGATLNNVTINEAGEYYGLWINGNGQTVTVNGGSITATNNGRGIKIADQYIDAPASVTLEVTDTKFNTAKKAAVLVSSKAGATITATNVDIENVAADNTNFAWVDEDWATYFGKVTVNGAPAAQESADSFTVAIMDGEKVVGYYKTLADAVAAAQANAEVKILKAGTYAVPTGKNITITGAVDGVVFDNIGAHNMGGASVTFNNVTFDYYPNVNYTGLQHSGNLVYNNCTFNGQVFLYGQSETFNKCTFNQNSADAYNVWTYGAKKVAFNECTFNSAGKSVLIYAEDKNLFNDVTVTDCDFIASSSVDGKAAIEMDSSLTAGIKLTIDAATTASGFDNGSVSGNSLWNNKKGNADEANNDITVVVNGVTCLKPIWVAQIGETKYMTLAAAIAAAQDGDVIYLITDIVLDGSKTVTTNNFGYEALIVIDNKTITIDFQGNTISVTPNAPAADGGLPGTIEAIIFVENGAKLTLTGNGGFKVYAGTDLYSLIYNCGSTLTIESGSYWVEDLITSGSIIYAENENGNHATVVNDGNFHACNAGENASETKPWIFNTEGKNKSFVIVNGGTFNQNILMNLGTQKDCEVEIPDTHHVHLYSNGWRVEEYTVVIDAAVGATCTTTGLTEGSHCDVCGEILVAQTVVDKIAHTEVAIGTEIDSTCTSIGMTAGKKCSECGVIVEAQAVIPVKAHTEETIPAVEPTFNSVGYTEGKKCSVCDKILVAPTEIAALKGVAQIGNTCYESLAKAIAAAKAGDTIKLLADVNGDVTISKSITIDGNGFNYAGQILIDKANVNSTVVMIKNVNFVSGTTYAIKSNGAKSITVENCTAKDYGYGFLHVNKSTPTVVVKNVTVEGGNYGFHWLYGTSATLENVTMKNVTNGVYVQNYASKTITLKNCDISSIGIWERSGYSGVQTFKFEGNNTVGTLTASQYAKYILTTAGATLTAPAGANVTTTVGCSAVEYANGAYTLVTAHTETAIGTEIDSTCTSIGMTAGKKCSECGVIVEAQAVIPVKAHTEETIPAVEPTFNSVGYTEGKKCSVCDKILVAPTEIAALKGVAQIGNTCYESLAKAIAAAKAGDTIKLLADVNGDVTISKSITIDGNGFNYAGQILIDKANVNSTVVMIKNVNFVSGTTYAIKSNGAKSITVENCTAKDYGYGFLHVNKSTPTVVVKNVTVEGGNYGFHWLYGTSATLENVTMKNVTNGVYVQNYASKTITLKNCDISSIGIWERSGYSGVQTFKFEGNNTVGTLTASQYAKYVLTTADATLTAPTGANVTTNVKVGTATYTVYYDEDGAYKVKHVHTPVAIGDAIDSTCASIGMTAGSMCSECGVILEAQQVVPVKEHSWTDATLDAPKTCTVCGVTEGGALSKPVAQIGDKTYASLADAIAAAKDGDVVQLIADIVLVCDEDPLINVEGKDITLDLNGKTINVNSVAENIRIVFKTASDAKLTITDSSAAKTGSVFANGKSQLYYMFRNAGTTVIAGGNFYLSAFDGGAMFFSENSNMTVTGGTFMQATTGWMFNTAGNGSYFITVTGGTFNRYFIGGEAYGENPWNEVKLAEKLHLHANVNGTWTIEEYTEVIDAAVGATCTTTGLTEGSHCGVCGEVLVAQTVVEKLAHTPVTDAAVGATCTTTGLTAGSHCDVCGEVLVAQTVVEKLAHTIVIDAAVDATCTATGLTTGAHCSVCNTVLVPQTVVEKLAHTEETIPAVAPTFDSVGYTEGKKCSVCGEILEAPVEIPVLSDPVAQIGSTQYATLAEAIEAAKNGDVVVLLRDATVNGITIGLNSPVQITLDLGGYTLSSADKALTVYRNGTVVTIKNGTIYGNSGGGTFEVTYGGKAILGEGITITSGGSADAIQLGGGTLVIGEGATVNGGIHCMETSGETVNTITITGGSFAGNLKINAQSTCTISGGTFTVDVTEWLAEGYNVKNNGDGTYTVVETMVAKLILSNGTEKFFATLSDALAAAKQEWVDNGDPVTVVLLENYEEASILCVPVGTTLDLNGHTITVGTAVIAYGPIIDTAETTGSIVIESDQIVHLQPENGGYMPLYDTANGCYRFFEYTIAYKYKITANNSAQFGIQLFFTKAQAYELIATGESKAEVKLYFTWEGKSSPMVYTFSAKDIQTFCDKAVDQLAANGKVTTAMVVTIGGFEKIAGKTLVSTGEFYSTTLVGSSVETTYDVPADAATGS